jgi:hypothetical protein
MQTVTRFPSMLTEQFLLSRGLIFLSGRYVFSVKLNLEPMVDVSVAFATIQDLSAALRCRFSAGLIISNSKQVLDDLRHLTFTPIKFT